MSKAMLCCAAGAGKTCIAHLMATGSSAKGVRQTVGCSTSVVLVEPADNGGLGDARQRPVFIELWDIGEFLTDMNILEEWK